MRSTAHRIPSWQKQLLHPSFDSYWQAMQPYKEDYAKINIPILTITGYFDDANSAAVNYLVDHYKYNKNAQHYLVVGPLQPSGRNQRGGRMPSSPATASTPSHSSTACSSSTTGLTTC